MKSKLFYALFFVLLSATGISAKADVVVNLNGCDVIYLGGITPGGFMKGLMCPHEADHYIVYFIKFNYTSYCFPTPATPSYRVEGTCDDYVVYRID